MALTFDVQYGGTVNINIRHREDIDGIVFNLVDENGDAQDTTGYTSSAFKVYDQPGLKASDALLTISQGATGLVPGTSDVTVDWDWSAVMAKLEWGYKYWFEITTTDSNLTTNQDVMPLKGVLYIGS